MMKRETASTDSETQKGNTAVAFFEHVGDRDDTKKFYQVDSESVHLFVV